MWAWRICLLGAELTASIRLKYVLMESDKIKIKRGGRVTHGEQTIPGNLL
jgi:hypothetical protein